MKQVAFNCVHNSCCSQIAEALGKRLASDVFERYSAGSILHAESLPHTTKNENEWCIDRGAIIKAGNPLVEYNS